MKKGSTNNKLSLYVINTQYLINFASHGSFKIHQICGDAEAECSMEQTFHKLRQGWEARIFQLEKFTLPACEPQQGLAETEKPAEGHVSNIQTASQHSCHDARFTITGEPE